MRLARLPCGDMTNPLLNKSLSTEQWVCCPACSLYIICNSNNITALSSFVLLQMGVKKINKILSEDYHCRRQMMIKRFQVTLESFAWGEKQKVSMMDHWITSLGLTRLRNSHTTVYKMVVSWVLLSVFCLQHVQRAKHAFNEGYKTRQQFQSP